VSAELVNARDDSHIWGAQYDRKPGDIFSIQDEISNEISDKLRLKLTRAEKKRLTKRQTDDPEAYRLYLKGRHHWNKWTEDGFYKAIDYFQQAVEKDPAYALASAGIADSYILLGRIFLERGDRGEATKYSTSAITIDPNNQEAIALQRQVTMGKN